MQRNDAQSTNAESGGTVQRGPQGLPTKMAVDANGFCWRIFEGEAAWTDDGEPSWSMARINPDNEPIPEPITFYTPESQAKELHNWLYAIWMAFLADEETHELNEVLRRLSAWMSEQEEAS